jgi:multidrug efflux pump subunit AcrA (membrane-fusion protein)
MNDTYYRRHQKTILILTGTVLLLILIFIFSILLYNRSQLTTIAPRRGPIIEAVYGIGTVTARRTYSLRIGVTSAIDRLYVREGDLVRAGEPLLKLREIPTFVAPYNGTVTSLAFSEGETVFPQIPILVLTDTVAPYLEVVLEQEGALRVRPGQQARFNLESLRGVRFDGTVHSIYPREGQFRVRIDAPDLPPEVLPGMTADVAIEVSRMEDALLIPVSALHAGRVSLLRGSRKLKIAVEIGSVDGEWAEVISGDIQSGDAIIVK